MPTVDGYIRVSHVGKRKRKGERFISPDMQRDALIAWADGRQDFELLQVFEELDQSGRRADRPLLMEAIRRVETGDSDGLVVWRVNRFGRSLLDGLTTIERVRAVGGTFYSVADGLDTSTDAGLLVLRILLSVAQWDAEQIGAIWATAKERAARRGVYTQSAVPVGYRKTRSGRLRLDPGPAVAIADVYRRRARGESFTSLCRYLEERQVSTALGNQCWNAGSMYRLLRHRVYLGEVYSGWTVNERAHPPLIDAATWEQAQHPNPPAFIQGASGPSLLRGLARCAACSAPLNVTRQPPQRYYRCPRVHAGGHCPTPASVGAKKLDQYIAEAFFTLASQRRAAPTGALTQAESKLAQASANLARYRDNDRIRDLLSDDAFLAGLQVRYERLRDARLAYGAARTRVATRDLPPTAELRRTWPELDVLAQRALLKQVIGCVFVARAPRNSPLNQRVTICPIGTEPRELPRLGRRGYPARQLRPIKPRRGWINPVPP